MDNTPQALEPILPELPEPDTHCVDEDTGKDVWSHSSDQMRTYALAAIEADRKVRAADVTDKQIQEVMFAVFDYASIADGIETATFKQRDQQRAKMLAQDRKIRAMLRALLSLAAPKVDAEASVPEGFVLVPVEPTEAMIDALLGTLDFDRRCVVIGVKQALREAIAAAPCGQQQKQEG